MFILDSLMISGIRWALETALTAAEAEMNDDSVLREQLLEAEMRREMGEIDDDEFRAIEADLLARIREIKERREGSGPIEFGAQPLEAASGDQFTVEASVSGDFHEAAVAPHTTVIEPLDHHHAVGNLVSTSGTESIQLLDMEPGDAAPPAAAPPAPRANRSGRSKRSGRAERSRSDRSPRPPRSAGAKAATTRRARTGRTKR
jgi:hypothetical protein